MKEQITEVWDWLCIRDKPEPADLIFIFGGDTINLPQKALELYRNDYSNQIIATGSSGTFGSPDWDKPEADIFTDYLIKHGVTANHVLSENTSSNSPENVVKGLQLLDSKNLPHKSVILISSPVHQRRAQATYLMHDRQAKVINAPCDESSPTTLEGFGLMKAAVRCVQEIERLGKYATKGDLVKQEIPLRIQKAYDQLILSLENEPAEWSGVILVSKNGDVIAMHRDDKSEIRDPDRYGLFGGAVEQGETALDAAFREIKEETNLKINREDFELFKVYNQKRDYLYKSGRLNVFVLRDIDPSTLKIFEGQGIKVLEDADSPKIGEDVREVFEDWFYSEFQQSSSRS